MVAVVMVGLSSSGDKSSNPVARVSDPSSVGATLEMRKASDSARLKSLLGLTSLSDADVLEADRLIHAAPKTIAHDSVHFRAVQLHLDSAVRHLKPNEDGYGATALAQPHISAISPPLTVAQTAKLTSLKKRLADQNRRIQVVAKRMAAEFMVRQRKDMAGKLENEYLDKGLDITVSANGSQSTTLRLKWILVNRVLAYKFSQNGEMFANLRNAGFKRLEITDGYDQTWYWDL